MDVLIVDDDPAVREVALQLVEDGGHYAEPAENGKVALAALAAGRFDLVLLDLQLGAEDGLVLLGKILEKHPELAVAMITGRSSVSSAVEAMKRGALDFLEKPFTREHLNVLLQRARKHGALVRKVETLNQEIAGQQPAASYGSESPAMRPALDVLFRAADSDASILLLGESGTGKSMIAREIHRRSGRAAKPFVTIHCPSLSRELLESELFGHVRGSFTGAVRDAVGKVATAEGGTLFLDEIGELPREIQPKLLRLLQEREFERVGENKSRKADVRVVAATNRDLTAEVAAGNFREDLLYRLNVISVTLPPLRERPEDLVGFARHFLGFFRAQYQRPAERFSSAAERRILGHNWPGNLRELRNAIERAVILSRGLEIEAADLPAPAPAAGGESPGHDPAPGQAVTLQELERVHIERILERCETLGEAARTLGIDEATLYRKRKKFGIS